MVRINDFSETNSVRINLRAIMSEIMSEITKANIEITYEKNRAKRRKLGNSRNQLFKASRIVREVTRRRWIEIT